MGTYDNGWTFSNKPSLHNYKATDGALGTREFSMYRAGTRSSNYTLSTNPTTVKALNQIGWVIDYNSVTTNDDNPVIWAVTTGIPLNEADPSLSDTTSRTWSDPKVVFEKGADGESIVGPAVRGPVEWTNTDRRWCAGKDSDPANSTYHEEDIAWIDIVTYTVNDVIHYYRCIKTHSNSTSSPIYPTNTTYWSQADAQYKFVATEVLVADAGAIDVLKSGSLLLRDTSDNVVGGAKGTDSDTGTIFWAGGTYNNGTITDAPFVVNKNGDLISTSGTIGGWTIDDDELSVTGSQAWHSGYNKFMPELPKLSINTSRTSSVGTTTMSVSLRDSGITGTYSAPSARVSYEGTFDLDPQRLVFSGNSSSNTSVKDYTTTLTYSDITFDSTYDTGGSQFEDFLNISSANGLQLTYKVDGTTFKESRLTNDTLYVENVQATDILASEKVTAGKVRADSFEIPGPGTVQYKSVVSSVGALQLKIAIVVDSFATAQSLFTKDGSGTYWLFNGVNTGVSATDFPNLSTVSLTYGGTEVIFQTSGGSRLSTGVVLETNLERQSDTIYIEI